MPPQRRNLAKVFTWFRRSGELAPTVDSGIGKESLDGTPGRLPPLVTLDSDSYRGVVIALLIAALMGMACALLIGLTLANPVILEAVITLGLSAGILGSVLRVRVERSPSTGAHQKDSVLGSESVPSRALFRFRAIASKIRDWLTSFEVIASIRKCTAIAGLLAIAFLVFCQPIMFMPSASIAGIAALLCLGAAGLAATSARYLSDIDPTSFPEGAALGRGARVTAWVFILASGSIVFEWFGLYGGVKILHFLVLNINGWICFGLFATKEAENTAADISSVDLGIWSLLGSRANILASILDTGERRLGIDLRSTWALTVVRRSLEPLVFGLCFIGWLSTSLTVVGTDEQGLIERMGVPQIGEPLQAGIRLHWPWPIDEVFRIPVQRIQTVEVGHEGEEAGGPENVLWAVEHAPNEYTLLLGNGRDLLTVDAAVQFRITDPRAWRYHSQNPGDALRAIAYRAVMRSTVSHTLSETLSENLTRLTGQMRQMVQQDADALGLGVDVIGFTVGGMHPPVPVAADYEAVVSAEVGKVTAAVRAQAYLNRTVPAARSAAFADENTARAVGYQLLARAAGEAWSFRTLESQYRASPSEYFFRRRLETLEAGLERRRFTVVDSRFQRDGGEIWLTR
jgi:regulator of protease activity HflC (stomatin/prohibitin superfamily)